MSNFLNYQLFGNSLVFIGISIIFLICLFVCDTDDTEYGGGITPIVLAIVYFGLNYFWSNFPILSFLTFRNVGLYLFVGFLFSIVRTYFKGLELKKDEYEKKRFKLKDNVFRWWFMFPICLVKWLFSRLLVDLFNGIYKLVGNFYEKLFNL